MELKEVRSNAIDLKMLYTQATVALEKVLKTLGPKEQNSGVHLRLFLLMKGVGGPKDMVELCETWIYGKTNLEGWRQFKIFTYEKALRLAIWAKRHPSILSSYQAGRDRNENRYAGAIRVRCIVPKLSPDPVWLIISISGLSEMSDEAVALLIAKSMPWGADIRDLGDIARASRNEQARELLLAA